MAKKQKSHYPEQRVGIFIDVQNLYHSAKNLYNGGRVNYRELLDSLTGGRTLLRSVAYVVRSETAQGEEAFFEALEKEGIELRMKDLQVFPGGMKKADWDIGMAVDALRMSSFLDVIVLATGDGDFIPAVEYLKWGTGRLIEVAAFERSASSELQEVADTFINLEDNKNIILKK